MKRGNLLFALGVAAAVLLITGLLLAYIRRAEPEPLPAPAGAARLLCAELSQIGS